MSVFNLFDLGDKEFYYRASRYAEANWLHGIPVIYTPALGYDTDVNNDPTPVLGDPRSIHVMVTQLPKATLEKRNWITEGEQAIVLEISSINFPEYKTWRNNGSDMDKVDSFNVPIGRYSKIKLPYKMISEGENDYTVMNVLGDSVRPLIWQCQIAPDRLVADLNPRTEIINNGDNKKSNLTSSLINIELSDDDEPTIGH